MKITLFPRLAITGIKKNRRLYLPYIATCAGMVMMSYILQSLSYSKSLKQMPGGGTAESVLSLGKIVIAIFALIFLNYTNSFLIRRRNKEFGLYNVLGMDKKGITKIVAWESFFIAVIGLVVGVVCGIAFSKLAELGLINAVHGSINYDFSVSSSAVIFTVAVFAVIFSLLFVKSIWQVYHHDPIELLRSENVGEKAPKANGFIAFGGFLLLAGAYAIAVTTRSPLQALMLFFVAVIMVIVATYMMFCSGSVTICRALQKNKAYYYKKNHFVSVSSMIYRMKRNGAGLASICILSTMVLVMISSTLSLYIGAEDSIEGRFPRENEISLTVNRFSDFSDETFSTFRNGYEDVFKKHSLKPENVLDYRYAAIAGLLTGSDIDPHVDEKSASSFNYDRIRQIFFINQQDYNRIANDKIKLSGNEAMVHAFRCEYDLPELSIGDTHFEIKGKLDNFSDSGLSIPLMATSAVPTIVVIVSDFDTISDIKDITYANNDVSMLTLKWYYAYDIDCENEEKIAVLDEQRQFVKENAIKIDEAGYGYSTDSIAIERNDFYSTFGCLFFLGIVLSIVFIAAAVLIIYYKQISEGYEDQSRFEIMQRVGMTKKDIRKSINSQVLTVFFAPLIFAGLHLSFAFAPIWKILQLFNLHNLPLVIIVTVCTFLAFCLIYAVIYKTTAGAYYKIVSDKKE